METGAFIWKIKGILSEYAELAAEIIRADVEIVDAQLARVCGTGTLANNATIISDGAAYDEAFDKRSHIIIQTPRKHDVCEVCSRKSRCLIAAEVILPMFSDGVPIGAIGVLCASYSQKSAVIYDEKTALNVMRLLAGFVIQMADNAERAEKSIIENQHENMTKIDIIRPIAELEAEAILRAVEICGDTTQGKREAAERLGIGVATLYRKLGGDK